jgi:hypothetical protein
MRGRCSIDWKKTATDDACGTPESTENRLHLGRPGLTSKSGYPSDQHKCSQTNFSETQDGA